MIRVLRVSTPKGEAVLLHTTDNVEHCRAFGYPFEVRDPAQAIIKDGKLIGWEGKPLGSEDGHSQTPETDPRQERDFSAARAALRGRRWTPAQAVILRNDIDAAAASNGDK